MFLNSGKIVFMELLPVNNNNNNNEDSNFNFTIPMTGIHKGNNFSKRKYSLNEILPPLMNVSHIQ